MKAFPLIFFAGCLFAIPGCSHKDKNPCNMVCEPPAFAPYLGFTIKEKTTGRDYFFSSPPLYPYSALKVSNLQHDTLPYHLFIDTSSVLITTTPEIHSFRMAGFTAGDNTLLLTIDGLQPDTLQFKAQFYNYNCCGVGAILTNVRLDGQLQNEKFDTQKGVEGSLSVLVLTKN